MKIVRILKRTFIGLVVIFLVIWLAALLKCEILTAMYGSEFDEIYRENTMIGDIDYLRVLEYSDNYAHIYYVGKNKNGGNEVKFLKTENIWEVKYWNTVWSDSGSASEVIWPYWWHFIYGGI